MTSDISQLMRTGFEHHRSGRLREAESVYRTILQQEPRHPDALHLLGMIAHQTGNNDTAAELIENAIKVKPGDPGFLNNCGEVYRALHKYELAVARYQQAIAVKPDAAGIHNNLGNAYREMGRLEDAIACYERTLAVDPGFAMAHNNLGVVLKEQGRLDDAVGHFKQALAIAPDYADAHNNLGNALHQAGQWEEAVAHYQRAIAIMPGYAEAYSNLGNALRALDRTAEAVMSYRQCLAIRPDFAMAHNNLGIALDELGRPEQAIASYEHAVRLQPDYAEAIHNLGFVLQELGRKDEAVNRFKQVLALQPGYAASHLHLSMLMPEQEQATVIEQLLADRSLPDNDRALCHFALGNIYNHGGKFDEAFAQFKQANKIKRGAIAYKAKDFSAYTDKLVAVYSREFFQGKAPWGTDSDLPVFIIGLPRSGTTLVEQILSSHPLVYGAGELESMGRIQKIISAGAPASARYPECMRSCEPGFIRELAATYLKELRELCADASRITSKDPGNFHRVGLIKLLFPGARLIHCRRNAMDTCTSIYFNHFSRGGEYSFDLQELGQLYLDYEKLMAHWKELFPADILEVQYEELVADQEAVSRALINHLRLDWDDRCLDFHENKRAVRTASSAQVRQPIYNRSVGRWRHYEKHLAPLAAVLDGGSRRPQ